MGYFRTGKGLLYKFIGCKKCEFFKTRLFIFSTDQLIQCHCVLLFSLVLGVSRPAWRMNAMPAPGSVITEAYRFVWGWEFMQDVCKKVDAVDNVLMSVGEHLT